MIAQSKSGSQILAMLPAAELALLEPHLETVELPLRRQLEQRNRPIEMIYFIDSGLASMVVTASANHNIEVGIVGKEGMTGLPVLLGCNSPDLRNLHPDRWQRQAHRHGEAARGDGRQPRLAQRVAALRQDPDDPDGLSRPWPTAATVSKSGWRGGF